MVFFHTESGLKLLGLDLASLATQGVGAGAQPNAYTGNGIESFFPTVLSNAFSCLLAVVFGSMWCFFVWGVIGKLASVVSKFGN